MDYDDKQEVLAAVNALITSPSAHLWYEALEAVTPLAVQFPVLLEGDHSVLNPLLKLRIKNEEAFSRVMELVESRRAAVGYDALRQPKKAPTKKMISAKYMAPFMEAKRLRLRVSVDIENSLRAPKDKLIGTARLDFMHRQGIAWKAKRDAFLEKARESHGGSLSKETLQAAVKQFWAAVDDDLEARGQAARGEALKPPSQRKAPTTTLGALMDALEFDPDKNV